MAEGLVGRQVGEGLRRVAPRVGHARDCGALSALLCTSRVKRVYIFGIAWCAARYRASPTVLRAD
jgi:hypothetical protein